MNLAPVSPENQPPGGIGLDVKKPSTRCPNRHTIPASRVWLHVPWA